MVGIEYIDLRSGLCLPVLLHVYLQQEVRVEEEERPEHNTLREEDTPTTEEEQHQSPSYTRRSPSSLLENLLG